MFTILATVAESQPSVVSEMFGKFGVNWPSFIASCVNFILVIYVLKRYAFGPIQAMLEQRRERIAEGEQKLKLIEKQLAESEQTTAAAIAKAHAEAVRMINDAKQGAAAFSEQKAQEAIAQAQQILVKAEAAAKADRERLSLELKREFGRLVATTTAQVAAKILTPDDQRRINETALAEVET
jgi:F-type H+-transporting ATPase subunit b